jgi:beta-phosphoglucomutase-like phosphatase (HAD superfamily)
VKLIDAGLESDPTLIPFLEYCRQSNIRLAIGSNSIRDRIEWVIKKMGIDHYFLCDVEKPER